MARRADCGTTLPEAAAPRSRVSVAPVERGCFGLIDTADGTRAVGDSDRIKEVKNMFWHTEGNGGGGGGTGGG